MDLNVMNPQLYNRLMSGIPDAKQKKEFDEIMNGIDQLRFEETAAKKKLEQCKEKAR